MAPALRHVTIYIKNKSPADNINVIEEFIIESRLEEILGASHILEENIDCTALYSEISWEMFWK